MSRVMEDESWPVSIAILPESPLCTRISIRNLWPRDGLFLLMASQPDSIRVQPTSGRIQGVVGVAEITVERKNDEDVDLLLLFRIPEDGDEDGGGDFFRNNFVEHSFPIRVPFKRSARAVLSRLAVFLLLLMTTAYLGFYSDRLPWLITTPPEEEDFISWTTAYSF